VDATSFELNVSVPRDRRYAETMRELAVHAARYAGCRGVDADRYGAAVEAAARACLEAAGSAPVPAILRRGDGPLEFLIACSGMIETMSSDGHITIELMEESGQLMCRIARTMPTDI
jgi:hypothetical protein